MQWLLLMNHSHFRFEGPVEKMSRSQRPPQKGKAKQVIHKMRVKTVHAYLSIYLFYFIIFDENYRLVVTCVGLFFII